MIVGYRGQVTEFEVVHIHREALFNLLLDEIIYHCVGFAAARRTQYNGSPKGIHDIDPAVVPTLFVVEPCRQIDRILAFDEPCFLHEALVLVVEHVIHEVVLQQAAHPQTAHQQTDITCANGQDIQSRHRLYRQRQSQYPPVEEEQHEANGKSRPNSSPSDFLTFHALCPQTGQGKQENGKQFRIQDGTEQPRRAVEVHQYSVHHADVHTPKPNGFIAEPVHVHDH